MHGYRTSHGGDLNENDNVTSVEINNTWLQQIVWGDLNENKNHKIYKRRYYLIDLLGWKH